MRQLWKWQKQAATCSMPFNVVIQGASVCEGLY